MKKLRIVSALLSAVIAFSAASCGLRGSHSEKNDFKPKSESKTEIETEADTSDKSEETTENIISEENTALTVSAPTEYTPIDVDKIKSNINMLYDAVSVSDNGDSVSEIIDTLLYDLDLASDSVSYITIDYYLDWYNEELENEYDRCMQDFDIIYEIISYAFCDCYNQYENYSYLFEEYVDEELIEYFEGMSIEDAEDEAAEEYEISDEILDGYYEIAYDDELSDDEKNLLCAEYYLELLEYYDTETFYEQYNRDYTPEDILEISNIIKRELIPVSEELLDEIYETDGIYDFLYKPVEFKNPFKTIRKYADELSPDIKKSADRIVNEKLYSIASGDNCYDGSFTTDLPAQNSALVYVNTDEVYSLITAIHEFGHFHASFYDETTTYSQISNLDIAEIQSQALELVFMRFYDDIYGKQSDTMKLIKTIDMLDSVIMGFLVGEFEYTVLKNHDSLSPEDVVKCFDEIMEIYSPDYDFYYISHMFEQPGYYISYGVSALAAFDIFDDCINAPEKALEQYEKIAKIPCSNEEYRFKSTLEQCGYSDVLSKEFIRQLADDLYDFADNL